MSDTDNTPTPEPNQETQEPQPKAVSEPERVSFDPNGNKYIRTDPDGDA